MPIHLQPPLFIMRKIVRENPWLLAQKGAVRNTVKLDLGVPGLSIETAISMTPETRAILQAEADAGTLFPDRKR